MSFSFICALSERNEVRRNFLKHIIKQKNDILWKHLQQIHRKKNFFTTWALQKVTTTMWTALLISQGNVAESCVGGGEMISLLCLQCCYVNFDVVHVARRKIIIDVPINTSRPWYRPFLRRKMFIRTSNQWRNFKGFCFGFLASACFSLSPEPIIEQGKTFFRKKFRSISVRWETSQEEKRKVFEKGIRSYNLSSCFKLYHDKFLDPPTPLLRINSW